MQQTTAKGLSAWAQSRRVGWVLVVVEWPVGLTRVTGRSRSESLPGRSVGTVRGLTDVRQPEWRAHLECVACQPCWSLFRSSSPLRLIREMRFPVQVSLRRVSLRGLLRQPLRSALGPLFR